MDTTQMLAMLKLTLITKISMLESPNVDQTQIFNNLKLNVIEKVLSIKDSDIGVSSQQSTFISVQGGLTHLPYTRDSFDFSGVAKSPPYINCGLPDDSLLKCKTMHCVRCYPDCVINTITEVQDNVPELDTQCTPVVNVSDVHTELEPQIDTKHTTPVVMDEKNPMSSGNTGGYVLASDYWPASHLAEPELKNPLPTPEEEEKNKLRAYHISYLSEHKYDTPSIVYEYLTNDQLQTMYDNFIKSKEEEEALQKRNYHINYLFQHKPSMIRAILHTFTNEELQAMYDDHVNNRNEKAKPLPDPPADLLTVTNGGDIGWMKQTFKANLNTIQEPVC